jgi:hypothetical protein
MPARAGAAQPHRAVSGRQAAARAARHAARARCLLSRPAPQASAPSKGLGWSPGLPSPRRPSCRAAGGRISERGRRFQARQSLACSAQLSPAHPTPPDLDAQLDGARVQQSLQSRQGSRFASRHRAGSYQPWPVGEAARSLPLLQLRDRWRQHPSSCSWPGGGGSPAGCLGRAPGRRGGAGRAGQRGTRRRWPGSGPSAAAAAWPRGCRASG